MFALGGATPDQTHASFGRPAASARFQDCSYYFADRLSFPRDPWVAVGGLAVAQFPSAISDIDHTPLSGVSRQVNIFRVIGTDTLPCWRLLDSLY